MNDSVANQTTKYVKKGMKLFKLGRILEAIECYDKAIQLDPKCCIAWSNKARAYDELNNMNEAMKCYKIALEINPYNASVWNNNGYAFRKQSKYQSAIECYDKAIKLQPNYAKAWYNKGYILEKQGKYEEALHCFDKAIEFNPQNEKYTSSRNSVMEKHKELRQVFDKIENDDINQKSQDNINQKPQDIVSTSPTITNKNNLDNSNIFVIMEKLQNAINSTQSFEILVSIESQIETILSTVKEKKDNLQRQIEENNQKCVICLDEPPTMICIPCGHMCLCETCKTQMTKKKCPICNQNVKNIYKVFK